MTAWKLRFAIAFAVLAAAWSIPNQPALAVSDVAELVGRWNGFFESTLHAEGMGPVVFDLRSARKGRFQGEMNGIIIHFRIEGALLAGDLLDIQGRSDDGRLLLRAQGKVRAPGAGPARVLGLRYTITDTAGAPVDAGTQLLIQLFEGSRWDRTAGTDLTRLWAGEASSIHNPCIRVELNLRNLPGPGGKRSTALAGIGTFFELSGLGEAVLDVSFDLRGTVSAANRRDGTSQVGLIGMDAAGWTTEIIFGVQHPPGRATPAWIDGNYLLFANVSTAVDWCLAEPGGRVFDEGTLMVQ